MKKERIIRIWFLGLFLLSTAGILYGGGIMERGSGKLVTENFDFKNFTEIDVSGSWNIQIVEGSYDVEVEVDDNIIEYVRVEKRGSSLVVYTNSASFIGVTFTVYISMPDLEKISTSGSSKVRFSGFDSDDLLIKSSGSSRMTGSDCTIEQLKIDSSGSSDLDLEDCEITDADVDLSGSTRVILTMTGGDLTGKMSGSGSITYYGEVSTLNVKSSGSTRVVKK